MRIRTLFRLTLLFVGLAALFISLNLAARGHLAVAAATAGSGAAAAGVAAWLLARADAKGSGRGGGPGPGDGGGRGPSDGGRDAGARPSKAGRPQGG